MKPGHCKNRNRTEQKFGGEDVGFQMMVLGGGSFTMGSGEEKEIK